MINARKLEDDTCMLCLIVLNSDVVFSSSIAKSTRLETCFHSSFTFLTIVSMPSDRQQTSITDNLDPEGC